MEGNFVVEAVCSTLNLSLEEARELLFDNDGQGIGRLKLNELKDIIRDLKAQGYSKVRLAVTGNKPELVNLLRAVSAAVKPLLPQTAAPVPPPVVPRVPPLASSSSAIPPHQPLPQAPAPTPITATASRAAHQPLPVLAAPFSPPPQAPASLPRPKSSSKKEKTPHKPVSNHPGHQYTPKAGDDPNHRARLLSVLSTTQKIQAYKLLKQVPGVTESEILDELETVRDGDDLDEDELMISIVTKRESATPQHSRHPLDPTGEADEEVLDELQEQENRDMDMAIRESEKERDVIQTRKRARIETLKQGQDQYLTSGEYQASVLLFGCQGCANTSGSSGNSGSGGSSALTQQTLLQAAITTTTTVPVLHRAGTNTSTHSQTSSNSSNSNGSVRSNDSRTSYTTSSYSYSSDGNEAVNTNTKYNGSSSSTNTRFTNTNSANSSSATSNSGVVDLTLDSDSDTDHHSSSYSGSGSNGRVCRTLTNSSNSSSGDSGGGSGGGSVKAPSTTNTHTTDIRLPTYPSTTTTCPTTHPTTTANNTTTTAPNMSRSVVIYTLARLLDELQDIQGDDTTAATNSTTTTTVNTSGTSSSGSSNPNTNPTNTTNTPTNGSSSSGLHTKPLNLYNRVYDISYLQHCHPHCTTLLTALRTTLSRLLLLESNATKYYKNTSTAYMVHTARRIDGKVLCDTIDQAVNNTNTNTSDTNTTSNTSNTNTSSNSTTTYYPDDCIYHLPTTHHATQHATSHTHYYIRHTTILSLLTHEADKLEKGMYKLQSDGSLVPYIFKKPRLAYYARELAANIDADGMEVVDSGNSSSGGGSSTTPCTNTAIAEQAPVDCSMMDSSEESVASEYNSDEDDF